jgi:hypothetical protein
LGLGGTIRVYYSKSILSDYYDRNGEEEREGVYGIVFSVFRYEHGGGRIMKLWCISAHDALFLFI